MHQTLRKSLEADESIRESIEAAKKVIALFYYLFRYNFLSFFMCIETSSERLYTNLICLLKKYIFYKFNAAN